MDCFQCFDVNGTHSNNILFENNWCADAAEGFMGSAREYHQSSNMTFRNNVFYNCRSFGIANQGITDLIIVNNTFINGAHGVVLESDGTGVVKNNIFYNTGTGYYGRTTEESNNLLYNTTKDYKQADFPNDIVNKDPLFVVVEESNYKLGAESPARNAGINLAGLVDFDKDGLPRPQESSWDIGAYEFMQ